MRKWKWTKRAFLVCLSFISSFSFLKIFQTLSNLFPCALRVWPLLTSLFFRLIFGWSCLYVKALSHKDSLKPQCLHIKWDGYAISRGGHWGRQTGEMTFPQSPKFQCQVCHLLCWDSVSIPLPPFFWRRSHPPWGFWFVLLGVRYAWEDSDNDIFLSPTMGQGGGGWKRNWGGSHCGHRTSPQALHTMTWTETDSLLKLMNWQMDTQLLGVSILIEKAAWHGHEQ